MCLICTDISFVSLAEKIKMRNRIVADNNLKFYHYFAEKIRLDISSILSPIRVHAVCQ